MFRRVALFTAFVLVLGAGAPAAELTKIGPGGELIGQSAGAPPVALKEGDRVKGPATVTTAAGDMIRLGADAVLEVGAPVGDIEIFSLASGWAQGEISERTQIKMPTGRLTVPEEGRSEFYLENLGSTRGLYRINKGFGKVLYEGFRVDLEEGIAIELVRDPGQKMVLEFQTLPGNPGDAKITAKVSTTLEIDVMVPRATMGRIEPWRSGQFTKVSSEVASSQRGKIEIETRPTGGGGKTGSLGPGTFAIINNVTGEIEFGFVDVDFAIMERAISLTSEFALLAVSNFFGLEDLK